MPLIPIALLVFAVATVIVEAQDRTLGGGLKWALAIAALAPTTLLLIGSVFAALPGQVARNTVAESALALVVLASILGLVVSFADARNQRLPAVAVCCLGGWLTIWSWIVASMSVTGDWL
jgi:hypothetical protein